MAGVPPSFASLFVPKLVTILRRGYGAAELRRDLIAGLTVAIVALPLAMALAIASGTTPERGLFTAIIAGFLISALGGSRYQIGGPTGAFVVVVFNIIERQGYDGLVLATLMAGAMLIAFGLARFGTVIKYMPYPVVTGFTAGIAVIIFTTQVQEFLGLAIENVPADVPGKWLAYVQNLDTIDGATLAVAGGALALILALRRYRPTWPGMLIAVVAASIAAYAVGLDVPTIGSRFGGIPDAFPSPSLPTVSLDRLIDLAPDAFTIAFLAGIESLLSAMVADGMTGARHRSNCELVAQGIANIASVVMGGIPATGAIARTATNVRAGGHGPVAGMAHAIFLLLFMLFLAPLANWVPLASLAAVLVVVAWNMSEIDRFRYLMSAPPGDRLVLLVTFALTVLVDLTVAIQMGIVLAALLFMQRMAQVTEVRFGESILDEDHADRVDTGGEGAINRRTLPEGVKVFQINGPFFFGVTSALNDVLDRIERPPKVFILHMRSVPLVDASGAHALGEFIRKCRGRGTEVVLTGVQDQPRRIIARMGLDRLIGEGHMVPNLEKAILLARGLNPAATP
ncbi:MAG: sulfate permease [Alphaproteobacteria bacterium]|nr:sulfate permease [Alphaproteobacteria bacterium]